MNISFYILLTVDIWVISIFCYYKKCCCEHWHACLPCGITSSETATSGHLPTLYSQVIVPFYLTDTSWGDDPTFLSTFIFERSWFLLIQWIICSHNDWLSQCSHNLHLPDNVIRHLSLNWLTKNISSSVNCLASAYFSIGLCISCLSKCRCSFDSLNSNHLWLVISLSLQATKLQSYKCKISRSLLAVYCESFCSPNQRKRLVSLPFSFYLPWTWTWYLEL